MTILTTTTSWSRALLLIQSSNRPNRTNRSKSWTSNQLVDVHRDLDGHLGVSGVGPLRAAVQPVLTTDLCGYRMCQCALSDVLAVRFSEPAEGFALCR